MLVTLPLKTYNTNVCYHAYVSPNVVKFFQNENICDKVFLLLIFTFWKKFAPKKPLVMLCLFWFPFEEHCHH